MLRAKHYTSIVLLLKFAVVLHKVQIALFKLCDISTLRGPLNL